MADEEISVAEAARTLKTALTYVYALIWAGTLPAKKTGGAWRIPAAAVQARLEARAK
jgi:excisionase family DNA binding protein